MGLKFIKKLLGTDKFDHESTLSSHEKLLVYKEFHSILSRFFNRAILAHIQPISFNDGVLIVRCDYAFMQILSDYDWYIINELNKKLREMNVEAIRFVVEL